MVEIKSLLLLLWLSSFVPLSGEWRNTLLMLIKVYVESNMLSLHEDHQYIFVNGFRIPNETHVSMTHWLVLGYI